MTDDFLELGYLEDQHYESGESFVKLLRQLDFTVSYVSKVKVVVNLAATMPSYQCYCLAALVQEAKTRKLWDTDQFRPTDDGLELELLKAQPLYKEAFDSLHYFDKVTGYQRIALRFPFREIEGQAIHTYLKSQCQLYSASYFVDDFVEEQDEIEEGPKEAFTAWLSNHSLETLKVSQRLESKRSSPYFYEMNTRLKYVDHVFNGLKDKDERVIIHCVNMTKNDYSNYDPDDLYSDEAYYLIKKKKLETFKFPKEFLIGELSPVFEFEAVMA